MPTRRSRDFFDRSREWSKWKHELLRRYLPKFAGIRGSVSSTVYFVDAFAGRGSYYDNTPVDGSPLVAAKLAQGINLSGNWNYRIHCINVEANRENYASLVSAMEPFSADTVTNLFGRFDEHLDAILGIIRQSSTLFFLDPFGFAGMGWDTVVKIANVSRVVPGIECLINFNTPKFNRDAGWLDSFDQKPRDAFIRLLDSTIGSDDWRAIFEAGDFDKETRYRAVTELYMQRLANLFQGTVGGYDVRTEAGLLKYYVFHVCRHPRGTREMSDVIYRVDGQYRSHRERAEAHRGRQMELFSENTSESLGNSASYLRQLEDVILQLIPEGGGISFGRIQDILCQSHWFGNIVEKHYRAACRSLVSRGILIGDTGKAIKEKTNVRRNTS